VAELSSFPWGCYKFRMAFNPLDWFRTPAGGAPLEPRRQFIAGLIVWVLAWLVVWWNQDARATVAARLTPSQSSAQKDFIEHFAAPKQTLEKGPQVLGIENSATASIVNWLGTFIGVGLFWGGGLLIFRPLTGWGVCLTWLRRCATVERLALVSAVVLTLTAIVLHWFWSHIHAWMLAAAAAAVVLALAFGWKLPGKKQP
jgi:hypothetical protein